MNVGYELLNTYSRPRGEGIDEFINYLLIFNFLLQLVIMVKNNNNLEEARTKRKVNEQNRRDRIKNDPVLYEEFKRKERERYHNRKKR